MSNMEASTSGRAQTAEPGPRSWAEDLNTYRDTRGTRALSAVGGSRGEQGPARYARTNLVPFAATRHPLFAYNDFTENQDRLRSDPAIMSDRCNRHGWGDVSLLKEDGYAGTAHLRAWTKPAGKGLPPPAGGKDGRKDLFGILQGSETQVPDSWIGHEKVDPTKGKGVAHPPSDPKGRRDLFDVLHAQSPGMPADDSWLGHMLVDPAKGKARPLGPEERRGRRDLGEIYNQGILREPKHRQAELLLRGVDKLQDGWVGNTLIDPSSGKAPVADVAAALENLHAATFKPLTEKERAAEAAKAAVQANRAGQRLQDTVPQILNGTAAGVSDWGKGGKRAISESKGTCTLERADNLYAHMTFRPLSQSEQQVLAKAFHDGRTYPRRTVPEPKGTGVGKGSDMLHFVPHQRVGSFVPYGGIAQEGRGAAARRPATSAAGSGGGSMGLSRAGATADWR